MIYQAIKKLITDLFEVKELAMKMISVARVDASDWKRVVQCTGFCHTGKQNPCMRTMEIDLNDVCRVYSWRRGRLLETLGFFCSKCHQFTVLLEEDLPEPFRSLHFTPVVESEPGNALTRNLTLDEMRKSDELKQYL